MYFSTLLLLLFFSFFFIVLTNHNLIWVYLQELGPDIAVCLDSWVGGIKLAHTKLVLRLPDNTRCVVLDPDSIGLEVFDEKKDSVSFCLIFSPA